MFRAHTQINFGSTKEIQMNNKLVIMTGRLAKDPLMDCDKRAKLELVDVSGFIHCAATGKQAELVMRDLKKDMMICIKGEWKVRELEVFYILKS